jgi:hypothetical protein
MTNVGNGSRTMAIEDCFFFNFAVVFDFNLFSFPPSKAKLIGDVLRNRQNAATWYLFFFSFTTRIAYCRTKSSCVTRRCAVNRKKIREIKFENYRCSKFGSCCLLAARCISISLQHTESKFKSFKNLLRFFLFMGTLVKDCALLGGNGNTLKIKTTAKLNSKQTSLATI